MPYSRNRYVFPAVGLVAVTALLAGCSGGPAGQGPTGKAAPSGASSRPAESYFDGSSLAVGVKKGQPGFNTKEGYSFGGFETDLLDYLEDQAGFKAKGTDIPSNKREEYLRDDVVKLVVATYSVTPGRESKVDFTAPYLKTRQGVLVRGDNTKVKERKDLTGEPVCSVSGSTSDPDSSENKDEKKRIENRVSSKNVTFEDDYKTCVKKLLQGTYEAVATDIILLKGFEDKYKDKPPDERVEVVDDIELPGAQQLYAIGLKEGHRADCEKLNTALRKFLYTGGSWVSNFKARFPGVANEDLQFDITYRPQKSEFDDYAKTSCGKSDK